MINDKELFEALMNGADPEKLAKDYAAALNAAIDKKKAEDARIQKEKEEAELKSAARLHEAEMILNSLNAYTKMYYPSITVFQTMTPADIDTIIASLAKSKEVKEKIDNVINEMMKNWDDWEKGYEYKHPIIEPKYRSAVSGDPILQFLRDNKLL